MANEVAIIETRAAQLAEKIEVLVTEARQKVASERLAERFGKGWSVDTLENARNFYNIYAKSKPVVWKFDVSIEKSEPVVRNLETTENRNQWLRNQRFTLPWSHYQILTHVKNSVCPTKPCFSRNCANGLRNISKRRARYE